MGTLRMQQVARKNRREVKQLLDWLRGYGRRREARIELQQEQAREQVRRLDRSFEAERSVIEAEYQADVIAGIPNADQKREAALVRLRAREERNQLQLQRAHDRNKRLDLEYELFHDKRYEKLVRLVRCLNSLRSLGSAGRIEEYDVEALRREFLLDEVEGFHSES